MKKSMLDIDAAELNEVGKDAIAKAHKHGISTTHGDVDGKRLFKLYPDGRKEFLTKVRIGQNNKIKLDLNDEGDREWYEDDEAGELIDNRNVASREYFNENNISEIVYRNALEYVRDYPEAKELIIRKQMAEHGLNRESAERSIIHADSIYNDYLSMTRQYRIKMA